MAKEVYRGSVEGTNSDGKRVSVSIYSRGSTWRLSGPGGSQIAHPSRKDLEGAIFEVELVFELTDCKFTHASVR